MNVQPLRRDKILLEQLSLQSPALQLFNYRDRLADGYYEQQP